MENTCHEARLALREFGQSAGLPDLVFDDEGFCSLTFDDCAVIIALQTETGKPCLYSAVGEVTEMTEDLLLKLLQANASPEAVGDGVLGACPDEAGMALIVVYSMLLDPATLNLERFSDALDGFVAMAEKWQAELGRNVVDNLGRRA